MRLIKALVAVVSGLALLVLLALFLIPTQRIAQIAAQQFEAATGRSLIIAGDISPSFYPVIGASAEQVSISNADWAGDAPLLRADRMEVGLDLAALIRGDIRIERVILQAPMLDLRRNAQGQGNWEFDLPGAAPASPAPDTETDDRRARQFSLALAQIENGQMRFRDDAAQTDLTLDALAAELRLPALEGPATLSGTARMNGQPLALSAQVANAQAFLSGAVTALTLEGQLAGAEFAFDGRAGLENLTAEGRARADIPALRPLMQALGTQGDELDASYLPLGFQGQVTRIGDGALYAREASLRAGGLRLSGAADLTPGAARPMLRGQFSGDVIDLRSADGSSGGAGAGAGGPQGWPRARIDARALGLVDAEIGLTLAGLRTDAVTLGATRLGVAIDNARAVADIHDAALFGGRLSGQLVANNRAGLSVRADLRARNIALLPLLTELADFRRLQGNADIDFNLLGVGDSVDAIMNSLRGDGAIRFDQGEIIGLDLAGMLRNLDLSYMGEGTRTVYDSITGSFTVQDGVLRNDDLRLSASRLSVTGRGSVGIGARNLDYRIVPVALRGADEELLRVPLMITGPWEEPRFRLDLEALAREQLRVEQERLEDIAREEAQRLEERARREAAERLERELGVEREEGERIEDTLRRGVEEELGRRLRGFLGGD